MDSLFPPRSWDGVDDVVIVGGGFSGLLCALGLSARPVTIVTAGSIGEASGSAFLPGAAQPEPLADAGQNLAEERVARAIAVEAASRLHELSACGVALDGNIDAMPAIVAAIRATRSIRLMEGFVAEQLRTEGPFVTGLVIRDRRGGLSDRQLMPARALVLATGGIRSFYEAGDGGPASWGEGLGMAARAGALIADLEFVQFQTIAPADPAHEIAAGSPRHIGGVHVDGAGRTTLDGLWACGEVACTGAHGASGAASALFLETLVLAARVAEDIKGQVPRHAARRVAMSPDDDRPFAPDEDGALLSRLREIMRRHVGPLRDGPGLTTALAAIARLLAEARNPRLRNALAAAQLIAAAALAREESRGVHQRSDFPQASPAFAHRTFATLPGR